MIAALGLAGKLRLVNSTSYLVESYTKLKGRTGGIHTLDTHRQVTYLRKESQFRNSEVDSFLIENVEAEVRLDLGSQEWKKIRRTRR